MFIDKTATQIGIASPLGLTIAYSLNNLDMNKAVKAAANIKKGIDHFVAMLASQNFKTAMIMSDGERKVTSIIPELEALGIEVDLSGAGGHVARVERRIRVIKERLRLRRISLTFCLIECEDRHVHIVLRIKTQPRTGRSTGMGP